MSRASRTRHDLLVYVLAWAVTTIANGHDVHGGSTTMRCPCETSGTVMLKPGETLTVHTDAQHALRDATLGTIATERGFDPLVTGGLQLAQFKVANVTCDLEFFSVVWHCATHKDVVLLANTTYTFTVPENAPQVATYFAWGTQESAGLRAGYRVPYDAALARSIAGFGFSATSALLVGNVLSIFIMVLAYWIWPFYDIKDTKEKVVNATKCFNCLGCVLHVYYVTMPAIWAAMAKDVDIYQRQIIGMFATVDAITVFFVLLLACDKHVKNNTTNLPSPNKSGYFAGITFVTAVLYFVLAFALPGSYWYVLGAVFAFFLLVFTAYVLYKATIWHPACMAQALQCMLLFVTSMVLYFVATTYETQTTYFRFNMIKWVLLACCFVVLALAVGGIIPEDSKKNPYVALGGAMFATAYVLMLFDSTSYVVVVFILVNIVLLYRLH